MTVKQWDEIPKANVSKEKKRRQKECPMAYIGREEEEALNDMLKELMD